MGLSAGILAVGLLVTTSASGVSAQSPSRDSYESLVRIEVPEAGVALAVPESWPVEVEMVELGRTELEAVPLVPTTVLTTHPPEPWLPTQCGLFMAELPPDFRPPPSVWQDLLGDAFAGGEHPREGGYDYRTSEVDLRAGHGVKYAYQVRYENVITVDFVEYYVAADDRVFWLQCFTLPALAPDDDWLSIAETIEFLPAEE